PLQKKTFEQNSMNRNNNINKEDKTRKQLFGIGGIIIICIIGVIQIFFGVLEFFDWTALKHLTSYSNEIKDKVGNTYKIIGIYDICIGISVLIFLWKKYFFMMIYTLLILIIISIVASIYVSQYY